jgi:uncharacterized protein (TIGR02466 family)
MRSKEGISFVFLLISSYIAVLMCKINEDAILRKCECIGDVATCDFSKLSKSKLSTLAERLLTFKIGCAMNDGLRIPIFTAKKTMYRLPSRETHSQAQVASSGSMRSIPNTIMPTACEFADGLMCAVPAYGIHLIFPTPILVNNIMEDDPQAAKHTASINKLMLDLEREDDGCKHNLHGGYRSVDGFLKRSDPAIVWLRSIIVPRAKLLLGLVRGDDILFDITGWGAVLRVGDAQNVHVHPGSVYAGVYYVTVPPEVGLKGSAGCLMFHDPRNGAPMMQLVRGKNFYGSGSVQVCPKSGILVMFPSWLQHEVKPLLDGMSGPRIAISFNIVFRGTKNITAA